MRMAGYGSEWQLEIVHGEGEHSTAGAQAARVRSSVASRCRQAGERARKVVRRCVPSILPGQGSRKEELRAAEVAAQVMAEVAGRVL